LINPATGAGTTVGAILPYIDNLVYTTYDGEIYGTVGSRFNTTIYSIDPVNASSTYVSGWHDTIPSEYGLGANPTNGNLYSSTGSFSRSLVTFDPLGTLSNVVPFNIAGGVNIASVGFAWNSSTNSLFGFDSNTSRLFQITDLVSATGDFVSAGPIGSGTYNSLTYSAPDDFFITIDGETRLLAIDPVSGASLGTLELSGDLPAIHAITQVP
jgi:hypothetical protein